MKYYLIAGEASGDLHARHLMESIRRHDARSEIRYWYRPDLAYMGFVSVVMHPPQILRGMQECKADIAEFEPDRLILVDYPGFNLKIASWFYETYIAGRGSYATQKIVYYIPPKIWAWKEKRIVQIRNYVDTILSILPFEEDWYKERGVSKICYVGNPTLDEISVFDSTLTEKEIKAWRGSLKLPPDSRVVALMPGSRRQEIELNLPMMLRSAMKVGKGFCFVIASAPNIDVSVYEKIIKANVACSEMIRLAPCDGSKSSFMLLRNAYAAMVTSGTATLETAIMRVPQVVCYAMRCAKFFSFLRKLFLRVPYVSLVNLIAGFEVVPELVAGDLSQERLDDVLGKLLADKESRQKQLDGYGCVIQKLGAAGAPDRAASIVTA